MTLRFCKKCHAKGAKKKHVMALMKQMAKLGLWPCPHKKPECGKVVGK